MSNLSIQKTLQVLNPYVKNLYNVKIEGNKIFFSKKIVVDGVYNFKITFLRQGGISVVDKDITRRYKPEKEEDILKFLLRDRILLRVPPSKEVLLKIKEIIQSHKQVSEIIKEIYGFAVNYTKATYKLSEHEIQYQANLFVKVIQKLFDISVSNIEIQPVMSLEETKKFLDKKRLDKDYFLYHVSGTTDMIVTHTKTLIVCPSLPIKLVTVKHKGHPFSFIIRDLNQCKTDIETIKTIRQVGGLNYIFDTKKNLILTFSDKNNRQATKEQIQQAKQVKEVYTRYEELKQQYAKEAHDNCSSHNEMKEYLIEKGYMREVQDIYDQYRKMLEDFIKKHHFNPYDYVLVNETETLLLTTS